MWRDLSKFRDAIQKEDWAQDTGLPQEFWDRLIEWIQRQILPEFLDHITRQVDDIIKISPDLSEPEILEFVNRYMVNSLGAGSASVRIYDPNTAQMLSYGSYPPEEASREPYIALEKSVAGVVVKTRKPCLVPNIMKEELYQDKSVIERKGTHSLMAIPLAIPRFFPHERDTAGVIQIYYHEIDRVFTPVEIRMAELMARRLSFVIARKKILSLMKMNEKKEVIVREIFSRLGAREGVKMKDVFNRVIPELADMINVQSCALFSVADDLEHVTLEAGYPDDTGYHGIGKRIPIKNEAVFDLILNRRDHIRWSPYDLVTQSYVVVMDPLKSELVSKKVKKLAAKHSINSILYFPLHVGDEITHLMTFDALDQRTQYSEEDTEVLLFLGRELMKAQRMERLDDILHDFKNPAIATAGFARRLKRLLEQKELGENETTITRYVDILMDETSRLQEMALSLYHVGKEQLVDLSTVLRKRFEINKEAIKEQLKQNVTLKEGPFHDPLYVHCYPLHLERILDNLLNNATNAIPLQGGILSIRTYEEGEWACAEITNTGLISEEERLRLLEGEGQGRGLYITHRIIRLLNGRIDIRVGRNTTTLVVQLPM
jgi:GAF domain-containing protein